MIVIYRTPHLSICHSFVFVSFTLPTPMMVTILPKIFEGENFEDIEDICLYSLDNSILEIFISS